MVSQSAEYALRAVLFLTEHTGEGPLRADAIAAALEIPRNYMGKILHALAKAHVLDSVRGPSGGFTVAVSEAELTLYDIVAPFGEMPEQRSCLLGQEDCSDEAPCTLHPHWKGISEQITAFFRETTIAKIRAASAAAVKRGPDRAGDSRVAGRVPPQLVSIARVGNERSRSDTIPNRSTDGGPHD